MLVSYPEGFLSMRLLEIESEVEKKGQYWG